MNKEEYYSRLKKTESKLLTDRCSFEESHNIALQKIYLKDKYIETLEKEKQQLENNRDKAINYADITTELIEQQPTEDDTWILDRLKGFKYILKGDSDDNIG